MNRFLIICIVSILILYAAFLVTDLLRSRGRLGEEKGSIVFYGALSSGIMFLSSFGVSDTALSVFAYKIKKCIQSSLLPGTIITSSILPMGVMAIAFLTSVEVEPVTLLICVTSQTAGALLGVRLLLRCPPLLIKRIMGAALLASAILIVCKMTVLGIEGGSAIGLSPTGRLIAGIAFFVFGGLNMAGMGATVTNMAVLLLLGMDSRSVFPVVMAGNIISCSFGAFGFIKDGKYTRKAAIGSVFGIAGVLAAVGLVNRIDIQYLQILMAGLLLYCGGDMLWSVRRVQKRQGG
ncbi:MAG: hypothetical protein ACK5MN_13030 [Lachnospiraceae bacterium]